MLKLPPPIWTLVYVLTATAISWFFGYQFTRLSDRIPGDLVGRDFVDSACLARAPRSNPLHQPIASLLRAVRINLPATPCIWASLFLPLALQSGSASNVS